MIKAIRFILLFLLLSDPAYAQTASILPLGRTQYFDNNGNPLSGGKVYNYIPGTLTFKTTWQDSAEAVANTNPVTLDAAGRALVYGEGNYRQIVRKSNGDLVWDAVTSSTGSGGGSSATGDGDLVGTVKPWAGIAAPNQYAFAYGQELSRTTYSVLKTAITQTISVICTSSSNTLTGLADTGSINVGAAVEVSCMPAGTTVISKTTSTVTLSNPASITVNASAVIFNYGNGNGSTTFNMPDLRGYTLAGRPNMGGTANSVVQVSTTITTTSGLATATVASANNLTKGMYIISANVTIGTTISNIVGTAIILSANATGTASGTSALFSVFKDPNSQYAAGGSIGFPNTLAINNMPAHDHLGSTSPQTVITNGSEDSYGVAASSPNTNVVLGAGANFKLSSTFALQVVPPMSLTIASQGSGTTFNSSSFQPTLTFNYIIKTTPDTNSSISTGVTSFGGMTGDIACGIGLLCTGNTVSVTAIVNVPQYNVAIGAGSTLVGVAPGVGLYPLMSTGIASNPAFRAIVGSDLPLSDTLSAGAVFASVATTTSVLTGIGVDGIPTLLNTSGAVGPVALFCGTATVYNICYSQDGRLAIQIGNSTDNQNYIKATTTSILSANGTDAFATFTTGLTRLGGPDTTTVVAQTLKARGASGVANTLGQPFTIMGSLSTGTAAPGNIVFQTGFAATGSASTQNAAATVLTIGPSSLLGSAADSALSIQQTLNTSGTPDVFKIAAIDTASNAATKFINLYAGAAGTTSVYSVAKSGAVSTASTVTAVGSFITQGQVVLATAAANGVINSSNIQTGAFFQRVGGNNVLRLNGATIVTGVNYVTINAADSPSGPTVGVDGFDTNTNMSHVCKGSCAILFQTNGGVIQGSFTGTATTDRTITLTGGTAPANPNISTGSGSVTLNGFTHLSNIPATVQGDILYGSAANTLTALAKDANATRYLSNTGTTNNPAWVQVNLVNGVTGVLPNANGGTNVASISDVAATFIPRILSVQNSGDTNDCASGSGSFRAYNLTYTVPANFLIANRALRIVAHYRITTDTIPTGLTIQLKMGSTVVALYGPNTPTASVTNLQHTNQWIIQGTAAPGAAANTETAMMTNSNGIGGATVDSLTAQPIALATNGSLVISIESKWASACTVVASVNQLKLSQFIVEALN